MSAEARELVREIVSLSYPLTPEMERFYEFVKQTDDRIVDIDNVPRIGIEEHGFPPRDTKIMCVKFYSEKVGKHLFVETVLNDGLLEGDDDDLRTVAQAISKYTIISAFEWEEQAALDKG
jgi:hypothetical protein